MVQAVGKKSCIAARGQAWPAREPKDNEVRRGQIAGATPKKRPPSSHRAIRGSLSNRVPKTTLDLQAIHYELPARRRKIPCVRRPTRSIPAYRIPLRKSRDIRLSVRYKKLVIRSRPKSRYACPRRIPGQVRQ